MNELTTLLCHHNAILFFVWLELPVLTDIGVCLLVLLFIWEMSLGEIRSSCKSLTLKENSVSTDSSECMSTDRAFFMLGIRRLDELCMGVIVVQWRTIERSYPCLFGFVYWILMTLWFVAELMETWTEPRDVCKYDFVLVNFPLAMVAGEARSLSKVN